jgi:hypothetical protein
MRAHSILRIACPISLATLRVIICAVTLTGQVKGVSWLDRPLSNWNTTGGSVPKTTSDKVDLMCAETLRTPATAEDRSLSRAGWLLLTDQEGPEMTTKKVRGTSVSLATSGEDGMCRPVGFQVFVFVEGQVAATISPSRTINIWFR